MAERPVSITPACVRAIYAGRKTQLRYVSNPGRNASAKTIAGCSLGTEGDLLWIREPWQSIPELSVTDPDFFRGPGMRLMYEADHSPDAGGRNWLPAKSMPRWASRVTVRISEVRCERLQHITEEDFIAEGGMWEETRTPGSRETEREGFARWWNAVHAAAESKWDSNPLVWVVGFQRIDN